MRFSVILIIIGVLVGIGSTAFADSINVAGGEVDIDVNGLCSLREAIINAEDDAQTHTDCSAGNGADVIFLPAPSIQTPSFKISDAPAAFDDKGSNGLPPINSELNIIGDGTLIERDNTLVCNKDGTNDADEFRIFNSGMQANLLLKNLTVQNGCADGAGNSGRGGGMFQWGGLIKLDNVTFSGNMSDGIGGAVNGDAGGKLVINSSTFDSNMAEGNAGAIGASGVILTISNSTISNNNALGSGGAIYSENFGNVITDTTFTLNSSTGAGGAIFGNGAGGEVTDSTFDQNSSLSAGGAFLNSGGSFTFERTTFVMNSAAFAGGAISDASGGTAIIQSTFDSNSVTATSSSGGAVNVQGSMDIINSTFSHNSADQVGSSGGAISNEGGTVNLSNSTFYGNWASLSGGGYASDGGSTSFFKNLIIGGSTTGGDCSALGTTTALGQNFDTDSTCPGFTTVTQAQLNLGMLQNNGGTTETHALGPNSVAIDATADCTDVDTNAISIDQRSEPRSSTACDVGSFEVSPFKVLAAPETLNLTTTFNIPFWCGERKDVFTMDGKEFTNLEQYETDIEIILPQKRILGIIPIGQGTANILQSLTLTEPSNFETPGQMSRYARVTLQTGKTLRLICSDLDSAPVLVDENGNVGRSLIQDLVGVDFHHGVLTIEADTRDLKVFTTKIIRSWKCVDQGFGLDCLEGQQTSERKEISSVSASIRRGDFFTQSLEYGVRTLATGRAMAFMATHGQVESIGVEIFSLNGRKVFSHRERGGALTWRLNDSRGRLVANGVYLYVLTTIDTQGRVMRSGIKKLVVLR